MWDVSTSGRWAHYLIPQVGVCLNCPHVDVNYHLTQIVSGHECFWNDLRNLNVKNSGVLAEGKKGRAHVLQVPKFQQAPQHLGDDTRREGLPLIIWWKLCFRRRQQGMQQFDSGYKSGITSSQGAREKKGAK